MILAWLLAVVAWQLPARGVTAMETTVHTGRELAAAFANPRVHLAILASSLQLRDTDFGAQWADGAPILNLTRSFTIQASSPLTLDFNLVKGKVRLLSNVTLTIQGVILVAWRSGSANQAPGIDLLLPVIPSGSRPPVLIIRDSFLYYRNCFPVSIALQSFKLATRPPEIPGNNTYDFPIYPTPEHAAHCSNDSTAPYLDQCYVYRAGYVDLAVHGLDVSATGTPSPNGYLVHSINSFAICAASYPMDCIVRLGPIGCVLFTLSQQLPPPPPASAPPDPSDTGPATAAIIGGVIGGVVGVALIVAAAALLVPRWSSRWRKRQQHQQQQGDSAKGSEGGLGGDQQQPAPTGGADGWAEPGTHPRGMLSDEGGDHHGFYATLSHGTDAPGRPSYGDGPFSDAVGAAAAAALQPGVITVVTAMTPPRADLCLDARISVARHAHVAAGSPGTQSFVDGATPPAAAPAPAAPAATAHVMRGTGSVTVGSDTAARPFSGSVPAANLNNGMAARTTSGGCAAGSEASQKLCSPPAPDATTPLADGTAAGEGGGSGLSPDDPRQLAGGDGNCVLAATITDGGDEGGGNEVRLLPRVLGKGAFGRVHEGEYRGQRVAVKVLLDSAFGDLVGAPGHLPPRPAGPAGGGRIHRAVSGPAGSSAGASATAAVYEQLAGDHGEGLPPLPTQARLTGSESGVAIGAGRAHLAAAAGAAGGQHGGAAGADVDVDVGGGEAAGPAAGAVVCAAGAEGDGEGHGGHGGHEDRQHVWHEDRVRRLLRQFQQEVEVLGRCDHPAVVKLLAACLTPPRMCLVMELCETSLEHLIYGRLGQVLELPTVLHIAVQVAEGLAYLHPTIIHRDLKPANVLIQGADSPRPLAKLTDFGLSRLRMATVATRHPDAGTPAYLAPECYSTDNNVVTHHMDMYALGVLLWSMLTGQRPWRAQCQSIVVIAYRVTMLGERPPLDQLSDRRCPQKLKRLIKQCWEHDPRKRPAAAQMVKELSELLRQHDDASGQSTEHAFIDADAVNMLGPATGAAPHLTPTAAASLRALRAFSTQRDPTPSPQRALAVAAAEAAAAMALGARSDGGATAGPASPSAVAAAAPHFASWRQRASAAAAAAAAAADAPPGAQGEGARDPLQRGQSLPPPQLEQQQPWPLLLLKNARYNESSGDASAGGPRAGRGSTPGPGAQQQGTGTGSGAGALVAGSGSGSRSSGRPQAPVSPALMASSSSSISEPHVMHMRVPGAIAHYHQHLQLQAAAAAAAGGAPLPPPLPPPHQQHLAAALGAGGLLPALQPHQQQYFAAAHQQQHGGPQGSSQQSLLDAESSVGMSQTELMKRLAGVELDLGRGSSAFGGSSSKSAAGGTVAQPTSAASAAAAEVAGVAETGMGGAGDAICRDLPAAGEA